MDWQWLKQFVTWDAFNTLVVGAFGAFFGAWGAQAVIRRGQTKQTMVGELNGINAALALYFTICNRYLSLKRQHVRAMRDVYDLAQKDFEASRRRASALGQPRVIDFRADLQTLTPIKVPIERLEHYIFEKTLVRGRALVATTDLIGAIDGLERSIEYRNELIAELRQDLALTQLALAERYFGLRDANGRIDGRFRQLITAIYNQTDDCIFFSRILADDLLKYGTRLRRRYIWRFRSRFPKFVPPDWSIAESAGLIPSEDQYRDWLRGFKKSETRLQRVTRWVRARLPTSTKIKDDALTLVLRVGAAASDIHRRLSWRRRASRRPPVKPLPLP